MFFLVALFLISQHIYSQAKKETTKTQVMTLGTFHFSFRNLDVVKTDKENQINVLDKRFQTEIERIVNSIKEFNPSHIAIEVMPDQQAGIDSLYGLYCAGKFDLKVDEVHQLGFRLAKLLGIKSLVCTNDFGKFYASSTSLLSDSLRMDRFEKYYMNSPDSLIWSPSGRKGEKISSIVEELIKINQPQRLKDRLGIYLLTPFKYEEKEGDFTGVDFETARWFNRNLRIFRNIQRIPTKPGDKLLVIYGAEHMNLLNVFFDSSMEYELVLPLPYLERARAID